MIRLLNKIVEVIFFLLWLQKILQSYAVFRTNGEESETSL